MKFCVYSWGEKEVRCTSSDFPSLAGQTTCGQLSCTEIILLLRVSAMSMAEKRSQALPELRLSLHDAIQGAIVGQYEFSHAAACKFRNWSYGARTQ